MVQTIAYLKKNNADAAKKYKVIIIKPNGKRKTIQFGSNGYSDFTKHKDEARKKSYEARHKPRENWTKSGITTAGFWSKWILWNKPSIKSSIEATSKKFGIMIKRGVPPKRSPTKRSR
jgi:hypothetical protein